MSRGTGRAEYALLGMGAVAYGCYTFVWFSLPAFLSAVIDEVGMTTTQAGLLVGAVPLVYVPLGLGAGMLIDRVGSRTAIGVGLAAFGLVQLARGVADGFLALLVPTLLLGVAGTSMTFGLPKLVSELFPPARTGSMTSVYQIGSQLGPAAAFGLARPVLGPFFGGWRQTFIASGAVVLAYAGVWLVAAAVYARSREGAGAAAAGEPADGDAADPDGTGEGAGGDERAFTLASARRDLSRLLTHRDMLLLVAVGTMYLFVNHGLRGWLAVILEGTGLTPELAGLVTSLLVIAQISGTVTIPPLSDRWNRRKGALMLCGVLCAAGTVGLLLAPGGLPAVVVVVWAVGMGLGGLSPMIKVVPVGIEGVGPALTATAVSFVYAVGEIGGFGGPFVIGALHGATGSFEVGLAALVAASVVIVAASGAMTSVD